MNEQPTLDPAYIKPDGRVPLPSQWWVRSRVVAEHAMCFEPGAQFATLHMEGWAGQWVFVRFLSRDEMVRILQGDLTDYSIDIVMSLRSQLEVPQWRG